MHPLSRARGRSAWSPWLTLLVVGLAGCGGLVTSSDGSGSNASNDSDAGTARTDGGASATGTGSKGSGTTSPSPYCSATIPSGSCAKEGLVCEYGSDYAYTCNTLARCEKGVWSVTANDCTTSSDTDQCPAESDVVAGAECTPHNQECDYADAHCTCASDHSGVPYVWTCYRETRECPYPRPRLGETCSLVGVTCDYSACGNSIACTDDGIWQVGQGGCHP